MKEEVAANCAGGGGVAGIGTGKYPDSEPGVPKKKKLSVIINNAKMLRRAAPKN